MDFLHYLVLETGIGSSPKYVLQIMPRPNYAYFSELLFHYFLNFFKPHRLICRGLNKEIWQLFKSKSSTTNILVDGANKLNIYHFK